MADENTIIRRMLRDFPFVAVEDCRESFYNPSGQQFGRRDVNDIQGAVFHQALSWGSVENVNRYHTGPQSHMAKGQGLESIPYTWAIRRSGKIVLCNSFDVATWSQGDADTPGDENRLYMAVMFEGMFRGNTVEDGDAGEPTFEQMLSAMALWQVCRDHFGWRDSNLKGHFQFGKPSCPGFTFESVIKAVQFNAAKSAESVLDIDLTTVKGRQEAMNRLGADPELVVDGIWGPSTKGVLRELQQQLFPNDRTQWDGVWGPSTHSAVASALTS